MGSQRTDTVFEHLCTLIGTQRVKDLSDAQLLQRFAAHQDEQAFTALMQRHGRLVLSVCRHVLYHEQDAEDAFQATFLVLARKAASIQKHAAVASWLYGVAYRIAMRAKKNAVRRREREKQVAVPVEAKSSSEVAWRDLQRILDEELNRLPDKYRTPFVLCCLEGKSKPEAAQELNWKEGTVSSRLAQARKLLQQRLGRRGVALSAVLAGLAVAPAAASAALPAAVAQGALKAAAPFAARKALASGLVTLRAVTLAEGLLRVLGLGRLKLAGSLLLLATLAASTAGAVLLSRRKEDPPPAPPGPELTRKEKPPATKPAPKAREPNNAPGKKDPAGEADNWR